CEGSHESFDSERGQGLTTAESGIQFCQLCRHPLPRVVNVRESERHLGRNAGIDETLPLRTLLLDIQQRLVHLTDVHAGSHILFGESSQSTAVRSGHSWSIPTGSVRLDELTERTLEHGRAETIERIANAFQQAQI